MRIVWPCAKVGPLDFETYCSVRSSRERLPVDLENIKCAEIDGGMDSLESQKLEYVFPEGRISPPAHSDGSRRRAFGCDVAQPCSPNGPCSPHGRCEQRRFEGQHLVAVRCGRLREYGDATPSR